MLGIAAAPRNLARRVQSLQQLNHDIKYTIPSGGGLDLSILTGSLVIERIFFIPGTGSHFVNSAINRDYTLAMGVTILYTVLVYSLNLVVDLIYTLLDPRISLEDE